MIKGKQPKKKLNPDWPYEEMSDVVADRICWPAGPDLVKVGLKFFLDKTFNENLNRTFHNTGPIVLFPVQQSRHYLGCNECEDVDILVYNSGSLEEAIEKAQKLVDALRTKGATWRTK